MRRSARWALGGAASLALAWLAIPRPSLYPEEGRGSAAFYDTRGRLLRLTLSDDQQYRLSVPLSAVSPTLVEATLLQEDRSFRRHPGVNPLALARAFGETYLVRSRRMGGSTITMQLARMVYRLDTTTLPGKLAQILRALQIERHYSKDRILEAYLDQAPYGGNVQGVGAASLIYFGKDAGDLTLAEALTLAVIPQNPVRRNDDPEALARAREVLWRTWISRHPGDAEKSLAGVRLRKPSELPFLAPHFVDAELSRGIPAGDDARVQTTLDLDLQRVLERQAKAHLEEMRGVGVKNAVAMLLDWRSMEVKALLGSADYRDDSIDGQVNGAKARRSPGSSLKPFVYGLAFQEGVIHPRTMLKDAPSHFAAFDVENADGEFVGPIAAADALIRSRNVPAVELANELKDPGFYQFLRRYGLQGLKPAAHYGLGLVLGGAEVSMEDELRLYAMLANGGELKALRTRRDDPPPVATDRLLSPDAAWLVLDVLAGNPRPETGYRESWTRKPLKVAWKTGTSHGFRDAWAVGIVGPWVLAVWMGNFDGEGNPALVGIRAAGPLFFRIVDALQDRPELHVCPFPSFPARNVARVQVCAISGGLPRPWCPRTVSTLFIPGVSPIGMCELHRKVLIDPRTGRQGCGSPRPGLKEEVYEFWPSDLASLFRLAGIPRRMPPPEDPSCPLSEIAAEGTPPAILSPRKGVIYNVRGEGDDSRIELEAVVDADVRQTWWFLDDRLIGAARNGESLSWTPQSGHWVVRAVDDHGRTDQRELTVTRID